MRHAVDADTTQFLGKWTAVIDHPRRAHRACGPIRRFPGVMPCRRTRPVSRLASCVRIEPTAARAHDQQ